MSFIWQIPSIPFANQELLCHGYVRRNYKKYIAMEITKLLSTFYSPTIYTLNDIKNSIHFRKYISPLFCIEQRWKFYLELWPNGSNEKNKGQSRLFFCFILIPPKIDQICCGFELAIKETNTLYNKPQKFFNKNTTYCPWTRNILPFGKLKDVEQLTISFKMNEMKITQRHKYRNPTTSSPKTIAANNLNTLPTQTYTWNIDDISTVAIIHNAPNVYGIASPIFQLFGLKWYITLCPNGSRITRKGKANAYLHLASAPTSDICVYIKQRLSFFNNVEESILNHTTNSDGWGMDTSVKTEDLRKVDRFYLTASITLIDVVAKDSLITQKFVDEENNGDSVGNHVWCNFKWTVSTIKINELEEESTLDSDIFIMFNLEWLLSIDEKGKVYLRLLRYKWKLADILSIRCYIAVRELRLRYTLKGIFDKNNECVNWGEERMSMDEFKKFGQCQLMLDMQFVDAYCNGKNVTHKFMK